MHTHNSTQRQRPQNILVVDDEAVIRDMMSDILDLEGYPIQVARNGKEALDIVSSSDPQTGYLIFLDLMMPVMDGYEFCRALSADPVRRQRHTIVIMSALDQLAQAQSLQVDQTMPKPFVVDDIMRIIQTYMP
ncbi:response regulator [Dictyobacter vulcani]|uniref:Response regulator n=1 Tax=Dictyobacter vulcani TaxID=2607529 RepID=A0A5J4KEN8_9CHLR|nr:response regulator [Dictyobacter vulcani]GER87754.1 response regulator [Dictyobacter vulcani]